MTGEHPPAPGWYPVDQFTLRYWNGQAWTGATAPLPPQNNRRARSERSPRRWRRGLIALGVFLLIGLVGSTWERQQRSATDLSPSSQGSQQEWIDYFERSDGAIDEFNTTMSGDLTATGFARMISALEKLNDSPDQGLNRRIDEAISRCESFEADACLTAINVAAERYNAALEEAEADGLIDVRD